MSVKGEITTDLYRQMMDLQEKLRQSEAERIRLEEMFTVLLKTFREEEDMRLKSLENRYHTFLEDCAKRSYRNEKILRSVERVESGANALHAKTERLKLLRNHYEAYLERIIPTWRQPALLRYGPNPIQSIQEVEWSRRNHLVPEENLEFNQMNRPSYGPSSRPGKSYSSNPVITSQYFTNRLSEDDSQIKRFSSDGYQYDKNYWNNVGREPEEKGRYVHDYEKSFQGDGMQHRQPKSDVHSKTLTRHFEDEYAVKSIMRGLESALHHRLTLGNRPDLTKNLLHQEGGYKEGVLPPKWDAVEKPERERRQSSPVHRDEQWFSDRKKEAIPLDTGVFDKSYVDDTPRMARVPVEIKKPEIIVGKHHPEASLNVDYFKSASNFETPSVESVKSENDLKSFNDSVLSNNGKKVEPDNVRSEVEVRQPNPQAKWGLLKHRRTIDKLKETLSFEVVQEPKPVEEKKHNGKFENLSLVQKSFEPPRKEIDETDTSQSLSEGWRSSGEKVTSPALVVQATAGADKPTSDEFRYEENINEPGAYHDDFQQKNVDDVSEEVYEDNEESYPESYYEQPPKSDYSRDIVSNVILEEDENEVNVLNELPEGPVQNQEGSNCYERGKYQVESEDNVQTDYNSYAVDGVAEAKESKEEYQGYQPNAPNQGYHDEEMYQNNYNDIQPQEEYTYGNQEVTNYNANNELEYATGEQYPGNETQQYYESDDHGNYVSEGMGQGENFDNAYNHVQNYEDNPAMEQYNQGNETYQQEYDQGQNGSYYSQGEYDGYYQSQQGQNGEYLGNIEEENAGYTEETPYGNVQGDANAYAEGSNNLPLRQSNLSHLLESDSESFQMEHGSAAGNEDSDFDFSMSQQQ